MKESIIKFMRYLADDYIRVINEINDAKNNGNIEIDINLKKELLEIKDLLKNCQLKQEEYAQIGEVFNDFEVLSNYILKYNLRAKEYTEIIFSIIIKNLSTNLLVKPTLFIDLKEIDKFSFQSMSKKEAREFLSKNKIQTLFEKDDKDLTELEKLKREELLEFSKKYSASADNIVNCHCIIKEHCLDKMTFFNKDDIDKVIFSLQKLGIVSELCTGVKSVLENDYKKRLKVVDTKKKIVFQYEPVISTKKLLTDKEYKSIKKELRTYYDFYNNQVIRPLTYEEVIYCVSKMIQLGEDNRRIVEFLLNTLDTSKNTLSNRLEEELNRLKFYQEKYLLEEKIQVFEQYYEEMLKANKDEIRDDYKFWRSALIEEYQKLQQHIPENYEYEIYLGKRLLKRKEEEN